MMSQDWTECDLTGLHITYHSHDAMYVLYWVMDIDRGADSSIRLNSDTSVPEMSRQN